MEHQNIVTKRRFKISIILAILGALLQSSLESIFKACCNFEYASVPLNMILFAVAVLLYIKPTSKLKHHQANSSLNTSTKSIIKISFVVLVLLLIFYMPSVVTLIFFPLNDKLLHVVDDLAVKHLFINII